MSDDTPPDNDCPRCRGGGCEWCRNTGRNQTAGHQIQISQALLQRIAARWVRDNGRSSVDYGWFLGHWRDLPGLTEYVACQPEMKP